MKIAVLISGGVDSSVALRLLKEQGHELTAFYLKIWLEEDFANLDSSFGQCPWEDDLVYVRKVCEDAGVPLFIVPLQKEYFESVVAYTLSEVKEGRTPNPDIFCNKLIKFGIFLDKFGNQFDKVATGHYARVVCAKEFCENSSCVNGVSVNGVSENNNSECLCSRYELRCAPDEIKDQTYFLSYLDQKQLSKLIFPIGHLNKAQVRELALKYNLPNKDRKDSQGICFLGKFKFQDFLKHYVGVKHGDLVEFETGQKLAQHEGFWFYTIGQRKGSGLSGGPWYVVKKDWKRNIVYLSKHYYSQEKVRDTFFVERVNWIAGRQPEGYVDGGKSLQVKLRHGKNRFLCEIFSVKNNISHEFAGDTYCNVDNVDNVKNVKNNNQDIYMIKLEASDQGIAAGQFAVFYLDDLCLGSGVISSKGFDL